MKRYFIILLGLLLSNSLLAKKNIGDLLNELDQTVEHNQIYSIQKEKKLDTLKIFLKNSVTDEDKYRIYSQLFDEYNSYKSDSALKYAREELSLAKKVNDLRKLQDSRLDLAFILSITGMYKESLDVLQSINKNAVPDLKAQYFDISKIIYGYMADNAVNQEKSNYDQQINAFRDSVLALNAPGTSVYVKEKAFMVKSHNKLDEALNLLVQHYKTLHQDIRKKANFAFLISTIYHTNGNREQEKYWLTLSAIYDLRSANKEYISLRSLAYILYEEGDIDRAYKYIRRSAEDALFCNARLRTYEVSQMLPLIDKAYQAQSKARQRQLVVSLACISFLTLLLLVALFFIYRQMRTLSAARKSLSLANEQLNCLNEQLLVTNTELKTTNLTLQETNLIKEEYIGRYMDQCSIYIDKMDHFRRTLHKKALAGKMDELLSSIKSKELIEDELKEFYNSFDRTFLLLFPTFVQDFTALLIGDEYIQLKPGQLLNTELRIYALMRLGITNGDKMAHFLRCSVSTIYNYRTKIRNKAIGSREQFEENVQNIGKTLG